MSNLLALQWQEQKIHHIRTEALRAAKAKRADAAFKWKQQEKELSEAVETARKQLGNRRDVEFLELLLHRKHSDTLILLSPDFRDVRGRSIFQFYQEALEDCGDDEESNKAVWTSICRFQDVFEAGTCWAKFAVHGTSKGYKGRETVFTKCSHVCSIASQPTGEEMDTQHLYFTMGKKNKCSIEFLTGGDYLDMHECGDVEFDYKSSRVSGTYVAELYWLRTKAPQPPSPKRQKCNDDQAATTQ